jgi:NOL1/NOP2/sun family putative RNA methylase
MNELFLERMRSYIPDEFDAYIQSLERDLYRGLRINPLKIDPNKLIKQMGLDQLSPFAKNSFYVQEALGLHPYHVSGAFYLQEPSASAVVDCLDVQPGDVVVDLCAAPGSKTTQILPYLGNDGLLICNEIDAKRAQALLSNLERMGAVNFVLTNMDTAVLCGQIEECADKILVDAPCSGEGMMKKHAAAKEEWSLENVKHCAFLQHEILNNAYKALKKDGIMVYSTCTYAKEENEEQIARFLAEHEDMQLVQIEAGFGRSGLKTAGMDASKVRRIFPMDQGEGHFIAKMKKTAGSLRKLPERKSEKLPKLASAFFKENFDAEFSCFMQVQGKQKENIQLFGMNHPFLALKKGKVIRQGVYLGEIIKKRFEPAHALYLSTAMLGHMLHTADLDEKQMDEYVHGLSVLLPGQKGYVAVCFQGIPFGFGKSDGSQIKNKYPKGLRFLPNSHIKTLS